MQIEELLPFYAIDALTDEERVFVDQQLDENPALYHELAVYYDGTAALSLTVEPLTPSAETFQGLIDRIEAAPKAQVATPARSQAAPISHSQLSLIERWRIFWASWSQPVATIGFAMAALLFIWAYALLGQMNDIQSQFVQLEADAMTVQAENVTLAQINAQLQSELERSEQLIAFAREPLTERFVINGTEAHAEATGQFLVDPTGAALLTVTGLEPLSAELTYQFWMIGADGPVSAGVFNVDSNGQGLLQLTKAGLVDYAAIGVSVEPLGGSEQPTGEIVMLAEL